MRTILAIAMLVACGACGAGPQALPSLTIPDCMGVNIHFRGRQDAQVEKLAAVGFRLIRVDFVWGTIEAVKGTYNFGSYNDMVDSLEERGIRPIFILDYGNAHYDNWKPPVTDESRAAYAAFAKAGAAHFRGRGVIWEIWNEPNGEWFWPNPSAEDYVKLARSTYQAIKEADPDAVVIGPATCGRAYIYLEKAFKAGLLECVDAVSVHPYGCRKPEDANVFYAWLRRNISKYAPTGSSRPLISGEWGYPSLPISSHGDGVTIEQQADYLARMFMINTMNGCQVSIWYDWRNDGIGTGPGDREHHFGVLYHDYTEKSAYFAMKTLASELNGYSFCRRVSLGCHKDYAVLFRKGDDFRAAVWTAGDSRTISIPVDVPSVTIVSLTGEGKRVDVKDGVIVLELTGSVQYIVPCAPSRRWALDTKWIARGYADDPRRKEHYADE